MVLWFCSCGGSGPGFQEPVVGSIHTIGQDLAVYKIECSQLSGLSINGVPLIFVHYCQAGVNPTLRGEL